MGVDWEAVERCEERHRVTQSAREVDGFDSRVLNRNGGGGSKREKERPERRRLPQIN